MKIKTLQHVDVDGKPLYYLQFNTINNQLRLNVGAKTVARINAMLEEENSQLNLKLQQENHKTK